MGDSPLVRDTLTRLNGVISEAQGGENKGLLLECEGVKGAVEKVGALRVKYAEMVFAGALNKHVAQGEKVVDTVVKRHLERGLLDLAVSSFNSQVKAPFASLLEKEEEASYIKLLPAFSAHVEKMEKFAEVSLRSKTRFLASKKGSGENKEDDSSYGGAPAGEPQSILGVFNGWKIEPEEPLKYKTVPMTVDLNPNLYNYVKELNTLGGRLNTESRKAIREVQAMPFDKPVSLKHIGDQYALNINYRSVVKSTQTHTISTTTPQLLTILHTDKTLDTPLSPLSISSKR